MLSRGWGRAIGVSLPELIITACSCLLPGCCAGRDTGEKSLFLYCGAGIRPAVAEIAEQFGKLHGITVECDYSGSNILLSRIKLSHRGDLYMPGDIHYVDQAEKAGLIHSKRKACYFIPVILVRKGNPKGIKGLIDLTRPGLKLGLGDPKACAIGGKSLRIFEKAGIPRAEVDRNLVFNSLTVNELGVHIKTGKIDAAIVWDATAAYYEDVAETVAVSPDHNVVSIVPVAVLSASENKELAGKFAEFVTSEQGKRIFRKHHYTTDETRNAGLRPK